MSQGRCTLVLRYNVRYLGTNCHNVIMLPNKKHNRWAKNILTGIKKGKIIRLDLKEGKCQRNEGIKSSLKNTFYIPKSLPIQFSDVLEIVICV